MYKDDEKGLLSLASPWIIADGPSWSEVLPFAEKREYKKNQVLIDIGQEVNHLYYLGQGQVKMTALTKSGLEKTIWYINSPNIVGEVPLLHNQCCKFQIVASSNCEIYIFKRDFVMHELANYPEIMQYIFKMLAQKVRVLSSQVEDLTFNTPLSRVARLFYLLASENGQMREDGNSCIINVKLTHQEVANITALHRVTATNCLKKLCDDGILEKTRNNIFVKDLAALSLLMEECE